MPHRTAHTWRHCESLAVDKEQNSDEVEVGNYTTQAHQQQLRGRHSPSSYPLLFLINPPSPLSPTTHHTTRPQPSLSLSPPCLFLPTQSWYCVCNLRDNPFAIRISFKVLTSSKLLPFFLTTPWLISHFTQIRILLEQ